MTVHSSRRLAKALKKKFGQQQDVPRFARATVVSALIGYSMVLLPEQTDPIPAFNLAHTTGLAAGTVVRVLIIGKQAEILGAYPTG